VTSEAQLGASATFCDYITETQIRKLAPQSIVDFGAGAGKYGWLIRRILGNEPHIIGVDGYQPAVDALSKGGVYSTASCKLLQNWLDDTSDRHSLAIFGDVIEHLTPGEIHRVMRSAMERFDHIIIVVPLHDIFQDDSYGNALEIHRAYITHDFFDRYKPVEKHIVQGDEYTIMNVLIPTKRMNEQTVKRWAWRAFHYSMLALQPVGLARPLVNLIKMTPWKRLR
jgi:hypothetical protein